MEARRLALRALDRIERGGAYANLLVPRMLDDSGLPPEDRRFVTELVYGTTRMRRACDWVVTRHLQKPPSTRALLALRLGAYQILFAGVDPHAAVETTVEVAPRWAKGLVNAVLRRVAEEAASGVEWPDEPTRLSYPDWIYEKATDDLGADRGVLVLESMNRGVEPTRRSDGYVQDPASLRVAESLAVREGDVVVDLCAAPGGKATYLAGEGASVVAVDVHSRRCRLIAANAEACGVGLSVVCADGRNPPLRPGSADVVLVDAPCSGLGVLHRRPDARWRLDPDAPRRLADLQKELLQAGAELVRRGGRLVYSVCTFTREETNGVVEHLLRTRREVRLADSPVEGWERWGCGWLLAPPGYGGDAMFMAVLVRS
ncbi:MAG: rRNA methyltransferase [Acidimicrobiales bacterium]|nr:MAG: rRNA methyltransferase [Acidimicrobiales bacterium]